MKQSSISAVRIILWLTLCIFFVAACDTKTASVSKTDNAPVLAGTWVLQTRIAEGVESPATQRFLKLTFNSDGSFRAGYRGDDTQKWIRAGQGGFSYTPPYLNLYWETGPILTVLVSEAGPERLVIHHGRNLVPLKDQEPDEIFVRQKVEKGPTRSQS
ncbi:MAG TPA: hypothetical protein VK463_19200 [Desulfomonilaceae bacterium]|nr:hypothetical protein [Desulfomonilaceae bacterium]